VPSVGPMLSLLVACGTPGSDSGASTRPVAPSTADTQAVDTATPAPTADTHGASCAVSELTVTAEDRGTLATLTATVQPPGAVAAWCSGSTADDLLFVESTGEAAQHELRLRGLAADTDYTCTAVPTCADAAMGDPATTTHLTPPPPPSLGTIQRTTTDEALGEVLFAATSPTGFASAWLMAWGPEGRPRWWDVLPDGVAMYVEARYHPDDDLIAWGGGMSPAGTPHLTDPWDGAQWSFAAPEAPFVQFHHDGKRLPDHTVLTLEQYLHVEEDTWDGFRIRGIDPETDTVFLDVSSQPARDAGWLVPTLGHRDPWHANWMDLVVGPGSEDPTDPELMVSLCYDWSVISLDPTTGQPRWILRRAEGWSVEDALGYPLTDDDLPRCTHGLEVDGDRVLLYDNGQTTDQSAVEEWRIDPDTKTATLLWSWTEEGWQEDFLGDVDWLADHVVVTQARIAGVPSVVEVDPATDRQVGRWDFSDGAGRVYRSELLEACDLLPQLVSACPATEARYIEVRGQAGL